MDLWPKPGNTKAKEAGVILMLLLVFAHYNMFLSHMQFFPCLIPCSMNETSDLNYIFTLSSTCGLQPHSLPSIEVIFDSFIICCSLLYMLDMANKNLKLSNLHKV